MISLSSPTTLDTWIGHYSNQHLYYFGRHFNGKPISYKFNSLGFRGPEFVDADITIVGSSFTFGVGLAWEDTWHQQLAYMTNKTVNVYSIAGYGISNNELIELYARFKSNKQAIIQLREETYSTADYTIPSDTFVFRIEESQKDVQCPTFTWSGFVDHAEDGVHPGPKTHVKWAKLIAKIWNL